eukprot:2863779-Alexandrium_andersonii.AAC.1
MSTAARECVAVHRCARFGRFVRARGRTYTRERATLARLAACGPTRDSNYHTLVKFSDGVA